VKDAEREPAVMREHDLYWSVLTHVLEEPEDLPLLRMVEILMTDQPLEQKFVRWASGREV
jgi:hypothetical protein